MGLAKQLLALQGKPAVLHCLDAIAAAGIDRVVAVIDPDNEELARIVDRPGVRLAVNDRPELEMAESVRAGLKAVPESASGILICLADQPLIRAQTMRLLCQGHRENPEKIHIPVYNGRRGHPTLFPRYLLGELTGSRTLRDIIRAHPESVCCLAVDDPGILLDMDTPEDYEMMRRLAGTIRPAS